MDESTNEQQYGTTLVDNNISKLTTDHPNVTVGKSAIPSMEELEYSAEFASNFNSWNFRSNGYISDVFRDRNASSAIVQLSNKEIWAPQEGWGEWISTQANNGDVARMMRTHSKIIIGHTLVGGKPEVRAMVQSDLDKILFTDKFLRMHLDWNVFGFSIAEPVFSKKDPEREKMLALQRVYKTKPTANEGSRKLTFRQPAGVEPTTAVPYASSTAGPTFTSAGNTLIQEKTNPFPWVETENSLPISSEDKSNEDVDVNWEWHIVDLLILNPASIRVCRNNMEDVQYLRSKFGNGKNSEWASYVNSNFCDAGNGAYIIAFVQYPFNEEGQESILFYPHELIFIPRYASHAYPNGVSQLREAYKEIVLREVLEEQMVSNAKRWGDPILKFSVNHNIWQRRDIVQKMLTQIKQSRSLGMDFVTPEGVETSVVESSGGVDLIGGPLDYINNKLNKIMQWADSFTESDSSNRSLGETQLSFMEIDAEPERKLFSSVFYKCIFLPLCVANGYTETECPTMSFDPINPKDKIEWGSFYSGLIDQMDSGQLNTFFDFIDLPYTNPIEESPMERELRIQKEEEEAAKREEEERGREFGGDEFGVGFGEESEFGVEENNGRGIPSEDVNVQKYPSPFAGKRGSIPNDTERELSTANDMSDVGESGKSESENIPVESAETESTTLSSHKTKYGKTERLNMALSNKSLRDSHTRNFEQFRAKLGRI